MQCISKDDTKKLLSCSREMVFSVTGLCLKGKPIMTITKPNVSEKKINPLKSGHTGALARWWRPRDKEILLELD